MRFSQKLHSDTRKGRRKVGEDENKERMEEGREVEGRIEGEGTEKDHWNWGGESISGMS